MVTGCAGGVLRDVLCNDVPLLFRSELYATVSVVDGLFYATAFGLNFNAELWTILTFVLGISFRLLAVRYKWEMPKFVFTEGGAVGVFRSINAVIASAAKQSSDLSAERIWIASLRSQ